MSALAISAKGSLLIPSNPVEGQVEVSHAQGQILALGMVGAFRNIGHVVIYESNRAGPWAVFNHPATADTPAHPPPEMIAERRVAEALFAGVPYVGGEFGGRSNKRSRSLGIRLLYMPPDGTA